MHEQSAVTTLLFTDIEGSTRLWEEQPERMQPALAQHDAIVRSTIENHGGVVVKMTGDGVHAAFADPLCAVAATLHLQEALKDASATSGIPLHVRCGVHSGIVECRDNDYFGSPVNRAARIMSAAHGGQILVSHAIATVVAEHLPTGVALRDLGSVRLRDLESPEHVYQVVHPDLRQEFPALRSLEATPNNLPQQVTSFIGRQHEMVEIRALLQKSRLVTLLGTGGLGKTRLSLQVAADLMDAYPDGVWFVELAPLTDARLVPQAVASVLGIKEEAGRPVQEALVKRTNDRRLLLILDNCEHVIRACAEIAKLLLQGGPSLSVLTSSREPLHIAGETTYAVPSLSLPPRRDKPSIAALTQYEAIRLFIDRAAAAQPSFQLNDDNTKAMVEICHRLDGIPLAIELAAARLRSLSIDRIAERLNDRFRLLTGGDRTALPRQQTLKALIDWSYGLLSEPERVLLLRLAVFAGGWTLEAAEAVGAGGDLERGDVLDLLTRLVEKSLVVLEPTGERYRLLETVREYARDLLAQTADANDTRTRHLLCYLEFAEAARPQLVGPDQAAWLSRLDLERENILAAHVWCDLAQDGAELGLRLVSAVKVYWVYRGLLELGHQLTVEALARPGAETRSLARCRALFDAGQLDSFMGRYAQAQHDLNESLAIAREIGDKERVAAVLQPLARASFGQGDLATGRRYLEEALELATSLGKERDVASALNNMAQIHRSQGELDDAERLYARVVSIARNLGDYYVLSVGLLNRAMVAISREAVERAAELLREAMAALDKTRSQPVGQSLIEVCAGLCMLRGKHEQAARLFGAAEAQIGRTGLSRDPADEAFLAPLIARAKRALGAAAFDAAEAAGRQLSYEAAIAEVGCCLENGASEAPR